jgi:hypothetical protein
VTDLAVDRRSKHDVEGRSKHGRSGSSPAVVIKLTNYNGLEYTGPITVGGQKLEAIYDTGSYDVIALSDHCTDCQVPSHLKVYRNKSSKTFEKGKWESQEHWFAGGSMIARQDFETVQLGSEKPVTTAGNMPIWQVLSTTLPQWTRADLCKFTTIVGLGFGKVAPDTPDGHPPVVQLLERAGTQRFTICLQKGKSNPGYITLNSPYDLTSPSSTSLFQHVPVVGYKHWAVEHNGVSYFNGQYTDQRCDDGSCVAVVDSGTSLIGVPGLHMAFISEFAARIKPDCTNLDKLPDLIFKLGGHTFPLPPSAYVVQYEGKCYAAFQQMDMASDRGLVWVLGLPFLRHYYTLWDRQGPGLYFAQQGSNCTPQAIDNTSMQLMHGSGKLISNYPEPTIADIRQARLPTWAPHGSVRITI